MKRRAARGISELNSMATMKSPEPSLVVEIMWGRFWPLCWPSLKDVICFSLKASGSGWSWRLPPELVSLCQTC